MTPEAFLADCKELYRDILDLLKIEMTKELRYPIYDASYFGDGYAHLTPKTAAALKLMHDTEDLKLDGTYAGKALGAVIDYAQTNKDKTVLFWNTFCTGDLNELGYLALPEAFHHYFTDPLQDGDLGV